MIHIVFVERWSYKIKNKLKLHQNEFLIELAQTCTYPKHLEFREQHGQRRKQHRIFRINDNSSQLSLLPQFSTIVKYFCVNFHIVAF